MTETADQLIGTVSRIVFHNSDNGWTVCRIDGEQGGESQTAVGYFHGITQGQMIKFAGQWHDDPKWGRQFKADSYEVASPKTLLGIERYLSSGVLPGIGPELAKRVVEQFGLQSIDVIENDPERLQEVEGIGPSRVEKIQEHYVGQKELQSLLIFLQGHGVSPTFAPRIHQTYGPDATRIIRENPYRMAIDIWGIGFRTADAIAQSLGLAPTSAGRVEAGLLHVLRVDVDNGHVHSVREDLVTQAAELLQIEVKHIESGLARLELSNLVIGEELPETGKVVSLWRMWELECAAAQAIAALATHGGVPKAPNIDKAAAKLGVDLTDEQRSAVETALASKICAITGGPGVGKTTIIKVLVDACRETKRKVHLCAPTGRASKRLAEATLVEASTIHRLLEYQPHESLFGRNLDNPLDADVIVVDEASMVDLQLLQALVFAVPLGAQLILVGDADQLPSVGAGNVLADLLASEHVATVRLTQVFRQAQGSLIIQVAHAINRGDTPHFPPPTPNETSDLYFIERRDPESLHRTLLEVVTSRVPNRFDFDPMSDIQVLSPMHRGPLGTIALNQSLQAALNPAAGHELKRGDRFFRQGDKVMQIKNDHDNGVYNGDIGVIQHVDKEAHKLVVDFGSGAPIVYERANFDKLMHAYAISVHKSQGSEYPCVVIPLSTQHFVMLQRNLLYTAVTRGKQLVVLIGSQQALDRAIATVSSRRRNTYLTQRLAHQMTLV